VCRWRRALSCRFRWSIACCRPEKRAGVTTFNARTLGAPHLRGVGAPLDVPIVGLPDGGRFQRALYGDASVDSYEAREAEAVKAAQELARRHPDVGAIVLECTNLVPHARAIGAATRLPVYDIWTLVSWFHAGLRPKVWPDPDAGCSARFAPANES
jgi:hypothetical protein